MRQLQEEQDPIKEAIKAHELIKKSHDAKGMLNYGELTETVRSQSALLKVLCDWYMSKGQYLAAIDS